MERMRANGWWVAFVGASRGIGVFLWDRASVINGDYEGVGVGNGSVTPVATAAMAGISATAMAAAAGGEVDDLVVNNGPVDTGVVDTS